MEAHAVPQSAARSRFRPKQRISHTKSRNGCFTCKKRHVKCDEERPTCGACAVRDEECVYPDSRGTRDQRKRQLRLSRETSSTEGDQPQVRPEIPDIPFRPLHFNAIAPQEAQNVDSQSTSGLNMGDLYLLQHYILHTSKKMTLNQNKSAAWQQVIPELAAENEFLMHLVLALAGLDILTMRDLYTHDGQGCLNRSTARKVPELRSIMEHHQQGLAGLHKALCVPSEPDAEALLAGSMLVAAFGFASFGIRDLEPSAYAFLDHSFPSVLRSDPSLLTIGSLHIQSLQLVRGVTSILGQFWPTLRTCRLRPLLHFTNSNEDWKLCKAKLRSGVMPSRNIHSRRLRSFAAGASYAVSELRALNDSLRVAAGSDQTTESSPSVASSHSGQSDNGGKSRLDTYEEVIGVVEDLYMKIVFILHMKPLNDQASSDLEIHADLEDTAIAGWPHSLPEEFVTSLASQASQGNLDIMAGVSLVLLAHLHLTVAIMDAIWCYGERCDIEIHKIKTLIDGLGDQRLITLMRWPITVIQG
ncbi:Fungal Zn(2)-Cys(6) binuclear cluster domain-containing protein [Penicillium ucsense]|uniref:Fungal Zn(2)-Cys(6) binuclear cluster domain-containing protein n=1 Tax=Penicillium ucsense TaxID=2839758 RepID=A0A8J8VZU1_9EURO|nr:Fungal Zn(2)-Cys(6) binuclear cluster domain-containing protein [Penicillium ucsense]KAF7734414.1 Fungal Zn(2)-Cys(6) binuclear cluster domain-containing protein [Penicillium ucsense]